MFRSFATPYSPDLRRVPFHDMRSAPPEWTILHELAPPPVEFRQEVRLWRDRYYLDLRVIEWEPHSSTPKIAAFILLHPGKESLKAHQQFGNEQNPRYQSVPGLTRRVKRCVAIAKAWNCTGCRISYLFGMRADNWYEVTASPRPVGYPTAFTDAAWVARKSTDAPLVCAWGKRGSHAGRDQSVLRALVWNNYEISHLGLNADGSPRDILRVPIGTEPVTVTNPPTWPMHGNYYPEGSARFAAYEADTDAREDYLSDVTAARRYPRLRRLLKERFRT